MGLEGQPLWQNTGQENPEASAETRGPRGSHQGEPRGTGAWLLGEQTMAEGNGGQAEGEWREAGRQRQVAAASPTPRRQHRSKDVKIQLEQEAYL